MKNIVYRCPRCLASYVENEVRFCSKFTEEALEEKATNFKHLGFVLTRETLLIWAIGGADCPGFKSDFQGEKIAGGQGFMPY